MIDLGELKQIVEPLFEFLQPYCIAIYLGGSACEDIIENIHDIDFICFSAQPREMCNIRQKLYKYLTKHPLANNFDFIQVRNKQNEEHAYGSYINKKMLRLIGEEIEFNFDVIDTNRREYVQVLQKAAKQLQTNLLLNQKRWYQIYRGLCILLNNSYEVTEEQKREINILHDLSKGWEEIRDKTITLLNSLDFV